jgi:type 1 glutamine amidotransferase
MRLLWFGLIGLLVSVNAADNGKIRVLLLDGRNNHDWRTTSPALCRILEAEGGFAVTVATLPPTNAEPAAQAAFKPVFQHHQVVIGNYTDWGTEPAPTNLLGELTRYVAGGGGFVAVHAGGSGFFHYPEMTRMVGLAWGLQPEFGEALSLDDAGKLNRTPKGEGQPTGHGAPFVWTATTHGPDHPIMAGFPAVWKHGPDELWYRARGPAEHLTILATAYSADTARHEPIVWTVQHGQGRVFATLMGHDAKAMESPAFAALLVRGCEWAATGKVAKPLSPTLTRQLSDGSASN